MPSFGKKKSHQRCGAAGHWVGDWNGGRAYGFLRGSVIRQPQRGRQGEDNAPYRVATRVRSPRTAELRDVAASIQCAGRDSYEFTRGRSVRSIFHGNAPQLIVAILLRNVHSDGRWIFGRFHRRPAEANHPV